MSKKRKKRRGKVRTPPRARRLAIGRPVPTSVLERLDQWPYHELLISTDWDHEHQLVQILASRLGPRGDLVVGAFLVDLGCLGVKNGLLVLADRTEYREIRDNFSEAEELVPCEPDLAARVLLTALEYADRIGFGPHPDAVEALAVLKGADPSASAAQVPLGGKNGKPLYVEGPHDNTDRVLRTLEQTVGEGNFEYILVTDSFEEADDALLDEDSPGALLNQELDP